MPTPSLLDSLCQALKVFQGLMQLSLKPNRQISILFYREETEFREGPLLSHSSAQHPHGCCFIFLWMGRNLDVGGNFQVPGS